MAGTENTLITRILYVEDNEIVRELMSELLTKDERHIVSCTTGAEALQEFTRAPFDLVITDVGLPDMSGVELARSILQIKPGLPIILASGYDLQFGIQNWGANVRSIIKPFDAPQIEALMGEMMSR